jgi:hypothetical protein
MLVRAADELPKSNDKRLPEFADANLPSLRANLFSAAPIYSDVSQETLSFSLTKLREDLGPDDEFVKKVLGRRAPREYAMDLVRRTKLMNPEFRKTLWDGGKAAIDASDDPMIQLAKLVDGDAREIRKQLENVDGVIKKNHELIGRARFAVYGTSLYPDATFTLRVSYGKVQGWIENGKSVPSMTLLGGAFERHTGADPFALPPRWLEAKDKLNPLTPFNFVTTNDIIGGNSGSPIINQNAEIVGIVFDGNIHSLGGEFWFDERMNRTVSVHSAAIVEALRKIYGATGLLSELKQ